jgi:hypothetical protein
MPGRLNDLRHIIYKSADAPWRRVRPNLGLMMKEGLLKENIDGEALEWAHRRMARPEARKILMVISDGAPVDDSTLSVNPANYLEKHLRDVIAMVEKRRAVELIAIGIGHDVTRYYQRAVTITDVEQLAGAMTEQLASCSTRTRAGAGDRRAAEALLWGRKDVSELSRQPCVHPTRARPAGCACGRLRQRAGRGSSSPARTRIRANTSRRGTSGCSG